MTRISHLRSLQALELAIRLGSLKEAARALSITPAAVGQRIRVLEEYLGTDLLLRGRSGLQPTPELTQALPELRIAFDALERVSDTLDFQRVAEIHIVADPDWAEHWLAQRLPAFREAHPNILFCINGEGDVPMRLGAPDIRIEYGPENFGEPLYTEKLVPVCTADNLRRIGDFDDADVMEGLPLLHLQRHLEDPDRPGWPEWFETYGYRQTGHGRGVLYRNMGLALEAMRDDVGFLICGLSLLPQDLQSGVAVLPFGPQKLLRVPHPYRLQVREQSAARAQMTRFLDWLKAEVRTTAADLQDPVAMVARLSGNKPNPPATQPRTSEPGGVLLSGGKLAD